MWNGKSWKENQERKIGQRKNQAYRQNKTLHTRIENFKGAFRRTKNQRNLSQIHDFLDKISLAKIKTRKSFKKGSENSQICHGKPTNTPQIQFLIDWSLNLSQIMTAFPPSNLGHIFIWDVFFVRRNAP